MLFSPMRKKRSLTLLEVIVAMLLLGFLLTGLFNCFRQGLQKNIAAKGLKQKVLQLELFQQKIKHLFLNQKEVWIENHPDAKDRVLLLIHDQKVDSEPQMCGSVQSMIYLTNRKELCLATWSATGMGRVEILLDKVDSFNCLLFDPKKADWVEDWPKKKEEIPRMTSIVLKWDGKELRFVFFLNDDDEKITYQGRS